MVTICTASLTFNNSTFCPHSVFMCFVWISDQTAIICVYNINWLVFTRQTESVYCAVRTGSLKVVQINLCNQLSLLSLPLSTTIMPLRKATTLMLRKGQGISILCLPDYWLDVSVLSEGPDTGQLGHGFLGFCVLKQMPRLFPDFKVLLNASYAVFPI